MSMNIGLVPELTTADKTSAKRWLISALAHPTLSPGSFPLTGRVAVYINGAALQCYNGYWGIDGLRVQVGNDNGSSSSGISMVERVAIYGAIISACEMWDQLTEQYSTAVARVLLESYNTAMSGLVQTRAGIATGLAFSSDRRQVAAKMGDSYYLPNGEAVDVTGAGWTVVE